MTKTEKMREAESFRDERALSRQPETTPRPSVFTVLAPILAIGYCLRIYRLAFGGGFHPDERHTAEVAGRLSWHDLNPHSFAYGSFPYYSLWVFHSFCSFFDRSAEDIQLQGRFLSALVGTAGIAFTFFLAEAMGTTRTVAAFAAALLAVTFFHVQNSHFFTVDIWLTSLSTLALVSLLKYQARGQRRYRILSGVAIGLSVATKITGLSLFLPVLITLFYRYRAVPDSERALERIGLLEIILCAATAFAFAEPYALLDSAHFLHDLTEQAMIVNGTAIRPFTLQYAHTPAWWYPLAQMVRYTMGWPLGIAAIVGTLLAANRQRVARSIPELIPLCWALAVFLLVGAQYTKFPRYLLPIYPVLTIFAAKWLSELGVNLRERLRRTNPPFPAWWASAPALFVLGATFVYTFCYLRIFSKPHVWYESSAWMIRQFPEGGKVVGEHWDDQLPIGVPGYQSGKFVRLPDLPIYEPESENRWRQISQTLSEADFIALPTARGYGSILNVPERYPQTANYYRLLFSGKLGFKLIRTFKDDVYFGPILFGDELADESLSVYTHPKVAIFRNAGYFDAPTLLRIIKTMNESYYPTRDQIMQRRVD